MKLKIDVSNPNDVCVLLGDREIRHIVEISINLLPTVLPKICFTQVEMKDGKPVRNARNHFNYLEEERTFTEIDFVGDWTKVVKANTEEEVYDDIPF